MDSSGRRSPPVHRRHRHRYLDRRCPASPDESSAEPATRSGSPTVWGCRHWACVGCLWECRQHACAGVGAFVGSPAGEEGRDSDETRRRVTIREPFAVGVREVTFAEWDACVSAGGGTWSYRRYR